MPERQSKQTTLAEAIAAIPNGARIAIGGNTFHRAPCAAVHELVRQEKRGLEVVKTAGSYDVDLLAAFGVVDRVAVGYVGFEAIYGLAPNYRRAVESGALRVQEHACYTVIAGLRAAIQGTPFMPVAGLTGSDVPAASGFAVIDDPYGGGPVVTVPALKPDVAIIHVQQADAAGNARISGAHFEDILMAKAARRTIITAERVVDGADWADDPDRTTLSGLFVDAIVEAPRGAWPLGCAGLYDPDWTYLRRYLDAAGDLDRLGDLVAAAAADRTPVFA